MECKAFTINIPSKQHLAKTDYVGMVSGKNIDKFASAGLTPVKSKVVNAPYVKEFSLVLECELLHTMELGLHTQFIGQILDIKAENDVLGSNGLPDIEKVNPLISSAANRAYYALGEYLGQAYSVGSILL
jgi:flavin reductase (DIM6/NTAB) family NADH-FMN oxidoreductase RutF